LNLTVDADHNSDLTNSRAVFKQLTATAAPGLCAKCHSIDDTPVRQVNWMALHPDPIEHRFNRFSHSAHMSLLDSSGCQSCHPMNAPATPGQPAVASAPATTAPDKPSFHSNFHTIDKGTCIKCHRPNQVRDDCLLCHNYHIGRFEPIVASAKVIPQAPPGGKM
jgi:nitrate/TMAO reductase-like tetraheme cytochrome c subunit